MNAIVLPFGDQTGNRSWEPVVSLRSPVPSMFMT
jgi:hypothetical protein